MVARPGGRPGRGPRSVRGGAAVRTVAVANQKGGVGKTTTVANLGASLASFGRRVLLVDLDPQASLTIALGVDPQNARRTSYDLLVDGGGGTAAWDPVMHLAGDLDLIPSTIDLAGAEVELLNEVGREGILKRRLLPWGAAYDYVMIDCPPSLGLLTINALAAAELALVPTSTQYLALRGTRLMFETIARVQARVNPVLEVRVLATLYDARRKQDRESLEALTEDGYPVLAPHLPIPVRSVLADAAVAGKSVLAFAPRSDAAEVYRAVARIVDGGFYGG